MIVSYGPSTVLGTENVTVNKINKCLPLWSLHIKHGENDVKQLQVGASDMKEV